jgi:hypothetical protein
MRHSSVETTMSSYVNVTGKVTLAEVRRRVGKNSSASGELKQVNETGDTQQGKPV